VEAPEPLEAEEKLVFLCHTPCVTLSGERPVRLHPKCCVEEPLNLGGLRHVALCPGLGWRHRPGRSRGPDSGFPSIERLRPRAEALACLGLDKFLSLRVRASVPNGYSP
jgi:hypothetical protein